MVLYKCDICDKEFNKKSNYNSHKNRKRPCKKYNPLIPKNKSKKIQKNRCTFCGKNYSSKSNLNKHMKRSCKGLKNSENLDYKNRLLKSIDTSTLELDIKECNDIEEHIYPINIISDKFQCSYCKKLFTKKELDEHLKLEWRL